ncbi:hypothetical protein PENSPDRAFT_94117 [Peniophora sp. CONT]|nr:hypothetical protein PENSPDRAFT_94117 [Peniophora sp. CONT]
MKKSEFVQSPNPSSFSISEMQSVRRNVHHKRHLPSGMGRPVRIAQGQSCDVHLCERRISHGHLRTYIIHLIATVCSDSG